MFPNLKTHFVYDANSDGAGGGQSDELPENLKAKYISLATFNGTKGQLEQSRDKHRADAERLSGEKQALESQVGDLNKTLESLKTQAAEAETLSQKLATIEAERTSQSTLNARLRTAMKYPELLGVDATIALVESSTLDPEALDTHLKTLSSLVTKAAVVPPPSSVNGETPRQPGSTEVDPQALMAEADAAQRKGDMTTFQRKMTEALGLMDAKEKFAPPQRRDTL